jgi:hypothetical protein
MFSNGGSIVAAGALQAQGGLFYTERGSWCSYSSSFAASGQIQAQGAVIIPVSNHQEHYR